MIQDMTFTGTVRLTIGHGDQPPQDGVVTHNSRILTLQDDMGNQTRLLVYSAEHDLEIRIASDAELSTIQKLPRQPEVVAAARWLAAKGGVIQLGQLKGGILDVVRAYRLDTTPSATNTKAFSAIVSHYDVRNQQEIDSYRLGAAVGVQCDGSWPSMEGNRHADLLIALKLAKVVD